MPVKTKRDEEKWEKAKEIAAEKGQPENYALIMGIYKKMKPDYEFKTAAERVALRHMLGGQGDCYDANGSYFVEKALFPGNDKGLRLVHGEVTGQGSLEGVKYGHCWIEDGNTVIDVSNGRNIRMPKSEYYKLGRIEDNIHVYTPEEARRKINQYEHWGPWDLVTSTGF